MPSHYDTQQYTHVERTQGVVKQIKYIMLKGDRNAGTYVYGCCCHKNDVDTCDMAVLMSHHTMETVRYLDILQHVNHTLVLNHTHKHVYYNSISVAGEPKLNFTFID